MKKVSGFTLIELLIVVAIIAILAAIAVPNFLEAQVRSKVSRVRSDMRSVVTGLESYRIDNNRYPNMSDVPYGGEIDEALGFHARVPSYITTPIAYMTSLPYDVFASENSTFDSPIYTPDTRVGERFAYFNYDLFIAAFPTSTSFQDRQEDAGSWLLYSYGPDRDVDNGGAGVYVNYDATNGTISAGNIFRTQSNPEAYVEK
jgi:general secretion pathway protein G